MKKPMSFFLAFVMVLTLFAYAAPIKVMADDYGKFGVGTWDYDLQGYRFSVYDYENHSVLSVLDVFSDSDSAKYNQADSYLKLYSQRKRKAIFGLGCKFEYLDIYSECGYDVNKMKNKLILSQPCYKSPWICSSEVYRNIFVPIKTGEFDGMSAENYRISHEISKELLKKVSSKDGKTEVSPAVFQIITKLGFYFDVDGYESILDGKSELVPFEDNYILVAEPIYWFLNTFKLKKGYNTYGAGEYGKNYDNFEYFYGTPTEWAIYNRIVSDRYHVNLAGGVCGYGVHPVMGKLTYKAAAISCMPSRNRTLGDYEIEKTDSKTYYDTIDAWHGKSRFEKIDDLIIRKMGYDIMTKNQIAEIALTVDINSSNTSFRPDTDAILSFKISQSEDCSQKYCPSYDDVGTEGAYGIKLILTTRSFIDDDGVSIPIPSELSSPIEILCDGLPAEPSKTLAYASVHMPKQTGTWRFDVSVDTNIPSVVNDGEKELSFARNQVEFFTNTSVSSKKKTQKSFTYEVSIQDPTAIYSPPPNTASDDIATDFVVPNAYESIYTLTAPVTELSWKYFKAVKNKDTGDLSVDFVEESDTARASMERKYLPCSYANVPSAKSAEISADGLLHTRSGYGIGIKYSMLAANGYYQNGFVLYPEFYYSSYADKLEYTRRGATVDYTLAENAHSMYKDTLSSEYSRVHFTPVWYPDGDYNIVVYMYDCWTPVGMLWDSAVFTIKLSGSVYDDWYITRS